MTKKAASSKSNRRQQLQLHCQASEENEPETDADGSAGRSFWDGFRAEQPKEHFMPEQSKLIGKEVYLLVLQQVITVTIMHCINLCHAGGFIFIHPHWGEPAAPSILCWLWLVASMLIRCPRKLVSIIMLKMRAL